MKSELAFAVCCLCLISLSLLLFMYSLRVASLSCGTLQTLLPQWRKATIFEEQKISGEININAHFKTLRRFTIVSSTNQL